MVTHSALKVLAGAAGWLGVVLLIPLDASAADTAAKVMAVQPVTTVKPVQAPPVVKAPVAMPKADPLPVMTKPIAPGPIAIQPVKTARPELPLTPIAPKAPPTPLAPKAPATPIGKIDAAAPVGDGSVTSALMQYQKDASKEARENHRLARDEKNLANSAKAEKLKLDNDSIQNGMDESREKAGNAMDAATTGLALGIVGGTTQVGAGAASLDGKAGKDASIDKDSRQDRAGARHDARNAQHEAEKERRIERAEARREREQARRERAEARRDAREDHHEAEKERRIERLEARREARDAHDKDSDSRKDGLEDKIGKMDGQQGRLKDQADKLNKTSEKMTEMLPQFTETGTGDVESQVQKVMLENQRQANADLKQQLKEVKDANARKQALRDAAKDSDDARGKDNGKGGKSVAAVPVTAAGATPSKTSLVSRPCTPINPC